MKKEQLTRTYIEQNREEILEAYSKTHRRANKLPKLTKKQRKALGIGRDQGKARVEHVRVSPSKVRIVLDQVRGKDVNEARAILRYTPKAAAPHIAKLLDSAIANAVNNNNLNEELLYVAECYADEGVVFKRYKARGRGSASPILKRTSHITVVVKERD